MGRVIDEKYDINMTSKNKTSPIGVWRFTKQAIDTFESSDEDKLEKIRGTRRRHEKSLLLSKDYHIFNPKDYMEKNTII